MTDWQLTATTIYCEEINDEVTVLVYSDGSTKCTGCRVPSGQDKNTARCCGPECRLVREYRDRLFSEEAEK